LDRTDTTTRAGACTEIGHPYPGTHRWMIGGKVFQIAPSVQIFEIIMVGRLRPYFGVLHDQLPVHHNRPFKELTVPFLKEGQVKCNMSLFDPVIIVKAIESCI